MFVFGKRRRNRYSFRGCNNSICSDGRRLFGADYLDGIKLDQRSLWNCLNELFSMIRSPIPSAISSQARAV